MRSCTHYTAFIAPSATAVAGLFFFSRVLSNAVADAIPIDYLGYLFFLTLVKYTPQLLLFSVFAGAFFALRQFFYRREMGAWFAAGLSLDKFALPLVIFATPTAVLVLMCTLFISPWAVQNLRLTEASIALDIHPSALPRGRFTDVPGGDYVYFRSSDSNIFIARNNGIRHEVIFTQEVERNADKALELLNGRLFRLTETAKEDFIETFAFESMRLSPPLDDVVSLRPRARQPAALHWDAAADRAEIVWRINLSVAALVLPLLTLILAQNEIRPGRRTQALVAVILFFLYLNFLRLLRELMEESDLSAFAALVTPPALAAALAWLLQRYSFWR